MDFRAALTRLSVDPGRTLLGLTTSAALVGGHFYGSYWKTVGERKADQQTATTLRGENSDLVTEIDRLKEELAQARSLLSGAPFPIPEEFFDYVEKDLGMAAADRPTANLATPDQLVDTTERNLALLYGQDGLGRYEHLLELMGIIPPGQNIGAQLAAAQVIETRGLLDFQSGKILLPADFDEQNPRDAARLVGLIGAALQMSKNPPSLGGFPDQIHAWQAIHHGLALDISRRFFDRRTAGLPEDKRPAPPGRNSMRESVLPQFPAAIQTLANFPLTDGAQRVNEAYITSRAALRTLLATPLTSTQPLLVPGQKIAPTAPPKLPEKATVLGPLTLRLFLEPFLSADDTDRFTTAWQSDQAVLSHANKTASATWKVRFSDPEVARKFHALITGQILPNVQELQPERAVTATHQDHTVTFQNSPKTP